MTVERRVSERMERFEKQVAEDAPAALEQLRAELTAQGGPLVEQLPGSPELALYTFVWFGDEGPVSVRCELYSGVVPMARCPLTRVPGTDAWYASVVGPRDVLTIYQFMINDPLVGVSEEQIPELLMSEEFPALIEQLSLNSFADPFNPNALVSGAVLANPAIDRDDRTRWDSLLAGPDADYPADYFEPSVPARELRFHRLPSAAFDNERTVEVYTPPAYDPAAGPYPLVILLDGDSWPTAGGIPTALDNLITRGLIPPVLAAFVHNPTETSRNTEMACNPALATLVADELLPFLRASYPISPDPRDVILGGCSFAGLASSYVAFERPDAVGNAISGSGSHGWCPAQGGMPESPEFLDPEAAEQLSDDEEPGWLLRRVAASERRPARFWIHIGRLETDMLRWSKRFRDVLQDKGYEVFYDEPCGGHEMGSMRVATVKAIIGLLDTQRP
jgi:enterochelin esterase family protein